jgi:rSAM/selenodomain-associated transferase 1
MLLSGAIIVMAKYPTPGKVKTRLGPDLSPQQAADVHRLFLEHFVSRLARKLTGELVICFDPPEQASAMSDLLKPIPRLIFLPQVSGDLGARIAAAAERVAARHQRLLFLGVDSPDVPDRHLAKAVELFDQADVSLSPTDDGGFWSLGLQRHVNVRRLLEDIPWSSGREALATLGSADAMGHTAVTGMAWDDIDHPSDLRRLLIRLAQSDIATDKQLLSNLRHVLPPQWFFG